MGRPSSGKRQYNIRNLWDTHHEIMRLLTMGLHHTEIAKTLGVSTVTVTNVKNSPVCQDLLRGMREERDKSATDMSIAIRELAPQAVAKLEEVMQCGLPNIELSAAKDILDRAGYTPIARVRTENYNLHFTTEEIAGIKQRARETGLISANPDQEVIECTP